MYNLSVQKGDVKLSKIGRPTDNKKGLRMNLRLTPQDVQDITLCADFLMISKSAVIRKAIECFKNQILTNNIKNF